MVPFLFLYLPLVGAAAAAQPTAAQNRSADAVVEIGTHHAASYRIDIPAHWNRGLVVFFHGYSIDPVAFHDGERISPMFDPILEHGFAVIQSAYSKAGWAVEEGSADSERLREYFGKRYGTPKETFAMGMSMGGTLTVLAIESAPKTYAGALSLCGAIEPTDALMQRDFALRAAFDYYFPEVFGPLVPVAPDYLPTAAVVAKVAAALRSKPEAYASLRAIYGAADARSMPDVLAFITYDIKEMQQRTHGNPFGNADLVYTGPVENFALNDGVRRYRADPRASAYMSRWYTPSGKLLKPLLALHDSGDPLVVASTAFNYALLAQRAGHGDNFVQQYVNAEGHCVFTPAQVGRAFDELVDWSRGGKRPASGRLR